MFAAIVIGIPLLRVLRRKALALPAGFKPKGAWPAPGVDKIVSFEILSTTTTTTTTTTTIMLARRTGPGANCVWRKVFPAVFIASNISSESPAVSNSSPTVSGVRAHHSRHSTSACAGIQAESVSGNGAQGIRRLKGLTRSGIRASRAPIRNFPVPPILPAYCVSTVKQ